MALKIIDQYKGGLNMKARQTIAVLAALTAMSACTWVKPVDGVEAVALVKPELAQNCKKLSKVSAQVKHKVGFVNRGSKKVAQELLTLARNDAVEEGADTIVALGEPLEGKQSFQLYKCR
ncbi:protein of unknown function [Alteromonadaceae bacterium Bs31]|nr:protein of unknown function [Alteromonadaceae bacterium Bs31]